MRRGAAGLRRGLRRCRCNTPTTRCGSVRFWARRAMAAARSRGSLRTGPSICWAAGSARSAVRPCAACGVELSRRQRIAGAVGGVAPRAAGAGAGLWRQPVHGAAGRACGAVEQAWCGPRHCDRQSDRGPHRQRAGRSGWVLRQHAGAADRHFGQSGLCRAARAGAGRQPFGLQPSGCSV